MFVRRVNFEKKRLVDKIQRKNLIGLRSTFSYFHHLKFDGVSNCIPIALFSERVTWKIERIDLLLLVNLFTLKYFSPCVA